MSWNDDYICPICGDENTVPMTGSGKIFLIGSYPGRDEISQGVPYVGGAGEVLRQELAYCGLDLYACRLANLWHHAPNNNDGCLAYNLKKILKKSKKKKAKAILLIGAQSVKYFTGMNVSDVNGLEVKSDLLSAPLIMACVQSATVFHQSLGEFRFAIHRFAKELEKKNLL